MSTWKKTYNSLQQMLDDLHPDNGMDIDTGHQVNQMKRIAADVVASAVVGDPEGSDDSPKQDFLILLEGHANPNRKAAHGDPKDWVRVTVTQK